MRKKILHDKVVHTKVLSNSNLDTLLEEYLSKLEQKYVNQSHQLQAITDNATSCLFMIDVKGYPTFMNPSAVKTTGYTLQEIKKKNLHDVVHADHQNKNEHLVKKCPIIKALGEMKAIKDREDFFIDKKGRRFPIAFSVAPLQQDGKPQGAVLEFQDITKRKELEQQKDDFIGVASHELKTPVTSMKSYTQILKKRYEKIGDTISAQTMGKIDNQINKLTSIITDLLDVTRTQSGNLNLKPEEFDMEELVKEVVDNTQLTSPKHIITIESSKKSRLTADRDRTGQVIINFLTNAIKYSPNGKKIIVKIKRNKNEIVVGVTDFGIGIPPEKLDQVFDRFMRVGGKRMETFGGLGLGLYISSQIIQRQGGRIWAKSEVGKGSTFYFSLPINI